MSLTFVQAASAVLGALGLREDASALTSMRGLSDLLRGSGVSVKRVEIVNHTIPITDDIMGGLVARTDGTWMPLFGGTDGMVVLSENGAALHTLGDSDLRDVAEAWVVVESVMNLNAVASFLRRHQARFIDLFICALIINFFALLLPLFSSFVYDKILGNGITDTLWALVIGLSIVVSIEFCVRIIRIATAERFAVASEVDIDHSVFRNMLDTSVGQMPTLGALLEKYKQILSYRDFLSSSYLLALADLPFIILFMLTIALVAGPLVLVGVICGVLMLLSSLFFTTPVVAYERQSKQASEKRFSLMTDLLTAREAVVGSGLRQELSRRWRHASVAAVLASSKARYWRGFGMTITNTLTYMSYVGILVGGVYMVEAHQLTSGGLLAASMLTSRMMGGFTSIITLLVRYREFRTALRELNQLVPNVVGHNKAAATRGRFHGAVRLDKVICRLRQGDAPVLNNVSLGIVPGEIVGIAGAPGAGKTTLLRLITGVLQPDEGQILIDNIPFEQIAGDDISANIGFKPQDFCLFDGTIEDNVRAGREAMTAETRKEVLGVSGLFRAFNENSLNWSTEIGARGSSLSGGQRQLVSLARAMLNNPSVLILDEPTNGLDAPLEAHLAQQLSAMRGKRTVIVSTHSRNILSICDRIIVVGQSRILADGPRDKIMV